MISHLFLPDNSSKTAGQNIFNTPFIVLLSVCAAVIVLLTAVVVYLIFRNRRLAKHPPTNQGTVFSNMAFKADPEDHLGEEKAKKSNDVDLGTGTTQTQKRQEDPGAIYEEASRPLPPIPVPHNTIRKEGAGEKDLRTAPNKANIAPSPVPRANEEHYMGFTKKQGNLPTYYGNTAPTVLPRAGAATYTNNYMPLSPTGKPGDTSYGSLDSNRVQTSGGAKQQGNNGKKIK